MNAPVPPHMTDLNKELENIYKDYAGREIEDFRAFEFELHTGIRKSAGGSHRDGAGGLLIDFLSAVGGSAFEDLIDDYKRNPALLQTLDAADLEDIADLGSIFCSQKAYTLSKAYQKRDWQDVCGVSLSLAEAAAVSFAVFEAEGGKLEPKSEVYELLLENVLHAEVINKYFQLHMILEAPVEAIRYTWSRESKDDVALYAPLMRKFAAARNDAGVTKVVAQLTADVSEAAPKAAKAKKPRAPKK